MIDRAEVQAVRDSIVLQDIRQLAHEVKLLCEQIRHLDTKIDILQADVDELSTSFRLHERLADIERCLAEATQTKVP